MENTKKPLKGSFAESFVKKAYSGDWKTYNPVTTSGLSMSSVDSFHRQSANSFVTKDFAVSPSDAPSPKKKQSKYKISFEKGKKYHGFFKCKNCGNKWSSNKAYFRTAQHCKRCREPVIPFPLAELK